MVSLFGIRSESAACSRCAFVAMARQLQDQAWTAGPTTVASAYLGVPLRWYQTLVLLRYGAKTLICV